jgi:HSP20 family protein
MPRETAQQDKRTPSKVRNSQSAQATQSSRGTATDRQTPIQTSRDDSRTNGQTQPRETGRQNASSQPSTREQQSRQSQQNRQTQSTQSMQRTGELARGGMSAAVRGGANSPFDLMRRMSDDMDRLLEQFGFGRTGSGLAPSFGSVFASGLADRSPRFGMNEPSWAPQVEVAQRGDRFVVRADLPGVEKDDVHVDLDDDVLTISGERRDEQQEERDGIFRSERSYGSFYRAIPLPEGVNADQCDAKFDDGVLEISLPLPKQEQRASKRIQIR